MLGYVAERMPMTIELTIGAMLFSSIFGVLLGVISALKRSRPLSENPLERATFATSSAYHKSADRENDISRLNVYN